MIFFILAPIIRITIGWYIYNVLRIEYYLNFTRLSIVSYLISSSMLNSYHLYIMISIWFLNIDYRDFYLTLFFFIVFCILLSTAVLYSPYSIYGDAENDALWRSKPHLTILIMYFGFYIITIPLACTVFAPFILYNVYMCPKMYFLLGNVYIFPIALNAIGRFALNDYFLGVLSNGIFFGWFPFSIYGPGFWIDGFDLKWFCLFMLSQIFYAVITELQQFKGSRFFCPNKCRRHHYLKFRYNLGTDPLDELAFWNLCLNCIYDVELEYKDANKNYRYIDFGSNCYLKLECGHIFHPNWLIRNVKQ